MNWFFADQSASIKQCFVADQIRISYRDQIFDERRSNWP